MTDQRILIIDDSDVNRYTFSHILRNAGFTVDEAESGGQGLAVAVRHPSLIMLDVQLPDIDGREVCRRLKADPRTADIPVLQVSAAFVTSEDRAQGLESGADGYLVQPMSPRELVATIRSMLRVHEAEQQEREAAQHWQSTFDAITDGIALCDDTGRVTRCNAAMAGLLGLPLAGVVGEPFFPQLGEALGYEGTGRAGEFRHGDRWYSLTPNDVRGPVGQFWGQVIVLADITARRQAEAERTELLQTVERALADREAMMAIVSHDLRNLLTSVELNTSLMQARVDESQQKRVTGILTATRRMGRLISDIMDTAQIESGHLAVDPQPMSLTELLFETTALLQPMAADKHVRLQVSDVAELPPVLADRERIQQVVSNLVGNAVKFTGDGGRVDLAATCDAHAVVVTVSDTGVGIPAEQLPHIFDRFWQGDSGRRAGIGLGLAIAKGIVQAHGGAIWVESVPGQGSVFAFSLPIAGRT